MFPAEAYICFFDGNSSRPALFRGNNTDEVTPARSFPRTVPRQPQSHFCSFLLHVLSSQRCRGCHQGGCDNR